MKEDIDKIETRLLAKEKEAYARIRREHGEICPCEYARLFTSEERTWLLLLGLLNSLKSAYVIDLQNPAEYEVKAVYNELCAMLAFLHDDRFFEGIGIKRTIIVVNY